MRSIAALDEPGYGLDAHFDETSCLIDAVLRHRAEAIAAGEPDGAQKHLRHHLSGTLRDLDKIRARHPAYLNG